MKPDEFDQQFDQLPEGPLQAVPRQGAAGRLRPRTSRPTRRRRRSPTVLSIEPSPSGDLIAAVTGNRKDRELDIVLVSAKDGSVDPQPDQRLRPGPRLRVHRPTPGMRFNTVPWMSWSPQGDRLAYFVPHREDRVADPAERAHGKIEVAHRDDDGRRRRSRPTSRPTAAGGVRGARRAASATSSPSTSRPSEVTNLTKDDFADYGPTWSPDGKSIVYMARVSGNEKLFRLDLATGKKTQLTFGTHDDSGGAVPRRRHAGLLVDGHRSRRSRSSPKSRGTATSTTSGRST